ncbi:MAG: peptidoglycan recognition protein family protein [Planctomycetota bacterium]
MSFLGAMSLVIGLLALDDGGHTGGFLIATNVSTLGPQEREEPIFRIDAPLDEERWNGIVIHHLGMPSGDAERVHRLHVGYGYQGLGYHFLVGNGSGLGDGIVHVGYRWNEQLPGAHVARSAEASGELNERAIGICLIGNGDRRPFTEKQMRSLLALVRGLQQRLDIPADRVRLHRDLAPGVTSPGRFFAAARLDEHLLRP